MIKTIACATLALLMLASPGIASETIKAQPPKKTIRALPAERTVIFTGYTRARANMELVTENAGRVLEVKADVGDKIDDEGIFARLDSTFTWLELKNNRVEQSELQETIEYYRKEADRYRRLVQSESAAQAKLDELDHQLEISRLQLESLKVQEQILKERLSRFRVKAPAGWTVIERNVEPGEWVAAGRVLGQVGDFTTLIAPYALAPDEYERLVAARDSLLLRLPDKGLTVPARIHRTDPEFDAETRKTGVELAVSDCSELTDKRGGIRAELELEVPEKSGVVLVPKTAVAELYEEHTLTRPNGELVRVVVLGPGPNGREDMLRVASPEIRPGDVFLSDPNQR